MPAKRNEVAIPNGTETASETKEDRLKRYVKLVNTMMATDIGRKLMNI